MSESPFWAALQRLHDSAVARDDQAIEDTLMLLETDFDAIGLLWPAGFFLELAKLLKNPDFLSLTKSWTLLYFINNNWEQLTETDRSSLKEVLIDNFDQYSDWMGAFVSSEILGERYSDESTLATFALLEKSAQLPARQFVPHRIEHVAKSANDEQLRSKAILRLRELRKNSCEEVREEALISLRRLGVDAE